MDKANGRVPAPSGSRILGKIMTKNIKAQIIGEQSSGMTALEIWTYYKSGDLKKLVYAHEWFANGGGQKGYLDGLADVIDCCLDAQNYLDFDGCDTDDETGKIVQYDKTKYTDVVASYDSKTKTWSAGSRMGQSSEILDALMIAKILPADEDHDPDCATAKALANLKFITAK
jgi:hypothetical protein